VIGVDAAGPSHLARPGRGRGLARWRFSTRGGGRSPSRTRGSRRGPRVEVTRVDISATEIRERVAAGEPIRYLVPEPVREIIEREGLYGRRL
jgi:nicotinic acid mononucleotide adenylyltransferase